MKIMRIEWIADDSVKASLPETVEFEDSDDLSKKEILFLLERKFGYRAKTFARDESYLSKQLPYDEIVALFGPPSGES